MHDDPRWEEFVGKAEAAEKAYVATVNAELYEMYQQDQADRSSGSVDWSEVAPRDEARRARVYEMIDQGLLEVADDHYHAAMVLQHGHEPEDYAQARDLAKKAIELDPTHDSARWLTAAAHDRHLQSIGESQIYGTQYRLGPDGKWTLEPIDVDAVTDEERAELGVPTLEQSRARVRQINGETQTGEPD